MASTYCNALMSSSSASGCMGSFGSKWCPLAQQLKLHSARWCGVMPSLSLNCAAGRLIRLDTTPSADVLVAPGVEHQLRMASSSSASCVGSHSRLFTSCARDENWSGRR
ncbi:hypothetical protein EON62_03565 [archaeon]|nr:MAG: hypothetical protein EON62_03565 [archaeon]